MHKNQKFLAVVAVLIMTFSGQVASAVTLTPGKIYLQVESHGEAWYISPTNLHRYYLGRPADAYQIMRDLGLGISNKNLAQIPIGVLPNPTTDTDTDGLSDYLETTIGLNPLSPDSNNDDYSDITWLEKWQGTLDGQTLSINKTLINRLKGRILIQTEKHGEAWYVFPDNGKRYFLGRATDAFDVMRGLGVGITNANLNATQSSNPEIFSGATYKVANYYEFKYPSTWSITEDASETKAQTISSSFTIAHKTIFTGDKATLTVYALDSKVAMGLNNLRITSKTNAIKDKEQDLIIGVKPGRKQVFRYTENVVVNKININKGAEFYIDIMSTPNKFIRMHMIVPNQADIATYEKTLMEMIHAVKILN